MNADLSAFEGGLEIVLREAMDRAERSDSIKALYWEFDLDNDFNAVFLCESYLPDLEWPGDFSEHLEGPKLGVHELTGDDDDAESLLVGRLFRAFGRALERLERQPTVPVAFSHHDGNVLYAPLPPGAMSLEETPRSSLPVQILATSFYALGPIGSDPDVHPTLTVDNYATDPVVALFRWRRHRFFSADTSRHELPRDLEGISVSLTRGPFEDAVSTHSKLDWVASDAFTRKLRGLSGADTITALEVTVMGDSGSQARPYYVVSADYAVSPVTLTPEQRKAIARGRRLPALNHEDVAGHDVLRVEVPYFWPSTALYVSGAVLRGLADADVLSGLAADEVIVLSDSDRQHIGIQA